MDSKAGKMFLVCALGTITGLLVAMRVPSLVWWVGALVGGGASSFFYALPDIVRYSAKAGRQAWKINAPQALQKGVSVWKKSTPATRWIFISNGMWWATYAFYIGFGGRFWHWLGIPSPYNGVLYLVGFVFLASALFWVLQYRREKEEGKRRRKAMEATFFASPLGLLFAPPVLLVQERRTIWKIGCGAAKLTVETMRLLLTFLKTLYVYIHSRELLTCFVDGALGVCISYLLIATRDIAMGPTLLVGGLIGGLLGLFNYQVVSKRILHIAPQRR